MIQSMTAFASKSIQNESANITWEIRSVNHRFLDSSLKLPDNFKTLEMELREILRQNIQRGRIECSLHYKTSNLTYNALTIDTDLVQMIANACCEIKKHIPETENINPLHVLNWPGVLQSNEDNQEAIKETIINLFKEVIILLNANRAREGEALKKLLSTKLEEITAAVQHIKDKFPEILAMQRTKLLKKLQDIKADLDNDRLEQEMVYFAQKIDITEETDRLETHVIEMKNVLCHGSNVGKRLDFLLQEFNRETNTIASKSVSSVITKIAVNMKVIIEQMREQVQNIE